MNFQPHLKLNNLKREREREHQRNWTTMLALVAMQTPSIICRPVPCKLRPPSVVRRASCVHRPSSLHLSFFLFPSDQPRPNLQLHVTDLQPTTHPCCHCCLLIEPPISSPKAPSSIVFLMILPPLLPISFS